MADADRFHGSRTARLLLVYAPREAYADTARWVGVLWLLFCSECTPSSVKHHLFIYSFGHIYQYFAELDKFMQSLVAIPRTAVSRRSSYRKYTRRDQLLKSIVVCCDFCLSSVGYCHRLSLPKHDR